MNTPELKARLAEYDDNGRLSHVVGKNLKDLLRECRKVIEEMSSQAQIDSKLNEDLVAYAKQLERERDSYLRKLAENVKEIGELREQLKAYEKAFDTTDKEL